MPDPWVCPTTPPCPHPGLLHDIEGLEDLRPTCCVDGCSCAGAVRYVAAARRLYLAEHIASEDGTRTRCGLDLTDHTELWQDIPPHRATRPCPECAGTETQGALC